MWPYRAYETYSHMLAAGLMKHVREEKVLKQIELNTMALREVIRHCVDNLFMEL